MLRTYYTYYSSIRDVQIVSVQTYMGLTLDLCALVNKNIRSDIEKQLMYIVTNVMPVTEQLCFVRKHSSFMRSFEITAITIVINKIG